MVTLIVLMVVSALAICLGVLLVGSGLMLLGSLSFALALLLASAVVGLLLIDRDALASEVESHLHAALPDDAGLIH